MKFKEWLEMNEVKDKSPLRLFLEQLAVPCSTAFMVGLVCWGIWVSRAVLFTEDDKEQYYELNSRIVVNEMDIDDVKSKTSVHDSEIDGLHVDVDNLSLQMQRGFDQNRELLLQLLSVD